MTTAAEQRAAQKRAENEKTGATIKAARQKGTFAGSNLGYGQAAAALREKDHAQREARDAQVPQKNVIVPPPPPPVGSARWGRIPQPELGGKTPIEVTNEWNTAHLTASSDEARASLSTKWGRPVTASEQAAIPGVDDAVRQEWSSPGVGERATQRADAAVPAGRKVRDQLRGAGVAEGTAFSFK